MRSGGGSDSIGGEGGGKGKYTGLFTLGFPSDGGGLKSVTLTLSRYAASPACVCLLARDAIFTFPVAHPV